MVFAVKYNIRIFISMHSAPYSNNNIETRDGIYEFSLISGSVGTMLNAIDWVARRSPFSLICSATFLSACIDLWNVALPEIGAGTPPMPCLLA